MKIVVIASIALAVAGCAATYNGPKTGDMLKMCRAEGHTSRTVGTCFEGKVDKYIANWRERDTTGDIGFMIEYNKAVGARVADGTITDAQGWADIWDYNNGKASQVRQMQAQQAAAQQARANAALTASSILLNSQANRPVYVTPHPVIPPYPADPVIIQQNVRPYRFIDSSPYR